MHFDPLESLALLLLNSIDSAVKKKRRSNERTAGSQTAHEVHTQTIPENMSSAEASEIPPVSQ